MTSGRGDPPTNTVLVIEDSRTQLFALQAMLEGAGYEVRGVESCEDALPVLSEATPDIILCDVVLPGMSGFDLCRKVRSFDDAETQNLPFILVTSKDHPEDVVKGLEAGANDYVTKPVNEKTLLARMSTQLRLQQLRRELESRNIQLASRNAEMERNLEHARLVHESLFPSQIPVIDRLDLAVRYLPHDRIGGDHYDFVRLGDHRFLVFIADVSGHGISGALFTATVKLLFDRASAADPRPASVLEEMNLSMVQGANRHFFVTTICALIDTAERTITYANAGHPSAILRRGTDGRCLALESQVVPLNVADDVTFVENTLPLEPGDFVVFYTDGVIELTNSAEVQYGEPALVETIAGIGSGQRAEEIVETIIADVTRFAGRPSLDDDMSVIVVRHRD